MKNGESVFAVLCGMDARKVGKVLAYNNKVHEFVVNGFKLLYDPHMPQNTNNFISFVAVLSVRIAINKTLRRFNVV